MHPFFSGIEWNKIYLKQFEPPRFNEINKDLKIKNYDYMCNREIMEDLKCNKMNNINYIKGWSFISKQINA